MLPVVAMAQTETPMATSTSAMADGSDNGDRRHGVVGTLGMTDGAYSIVQRNGTVFEFTLDDALTVKHPPMGQVDSSALVDGLKVGVLLQRHEDGSWVAIRAMIKPDRPSTEHVSGAVVSREGNVITIVDAQGKEHVVELPDEAAASVQVGDTLTAITDRRADGDARAAKGKGVVTEEQINERLRHHVEKVRARADHGEAQAARAQEHLAKSLARLEVNHARMMELMEKMKARVPEQAKARFEAARVAADERFETAKAGVEEARERATEARERAAQIREKAAQAIDEAKARVEQAKERAQN